MNQVPVRWRATRHREGTAHRQAVRPSNCSNVPEAAVRGGGHAPSPVIPAPLQELTPAEFDGTFGVNVRGTVFNVQKALPSLKEGASVILTGSKAASKGNPAFGVYAASKAALRSFTRTWPRNSPAA